jgi:hypothetical protein
VNIRPVRLAPCAAGARPRIAIVATGSPKPGSGRPQYSSEANAARRSRATCSRHDTRRGQRRQATISSASLASELSRRLSVVVRPALIPAALVLAIGVAGCSVGGSSTASSSGFTGARAKVAQTLNTFASDSSGNDATDICQNVLDKQALGRIAKAGNCKTIITNQLKTIDDFTLTIENIIVTGKTAIASVQTAQDGKKVVSGIRLTDERAGWRIDSFD